MSTERSVIVHCNFFFSAVSDLQVEVRTAALAALPRIFPRIPSEFDILIKVVRTSNNLEEFKTACTVVLLQGFSEGLISALLFRTEDAIDSLKLAARLFLIKLVGSRGQSMVSYCVVSLYFIPQHLN